MAKKTTTKKTTAADQPLKFTKGGFYLDRAEDLWYCTNGKTKKVNETQTVVLMKKTWLGEPVGDETEQLVESFAKHLSAAELKEYRAVTHREAEAEQDSKTTPKKSSAAPAKKSAKTKTTKPAAEKKMSALDAAAKVLGDSKEPMATKAMIEAMSAKGYWTSPGGQTPHATLYAAILREINVKGDESRFQKIDKGRFALAGK